jgi:hypothetical protein
MREDKEGAMAGNVAKVVISQRQTVAADLLYRELAGG